MTVPRVRVARAALWLCALLCAPALLLAQTPPPPAATAPQPGAQEKKNSMPLRMLALGDSYTIGESVAEAERWPEQLAQALRSHGLDVAKPQIIARTGWTTTNLRAAMEQSKLTPPYDLVTLLIGVNDQFQNFQEAEYPGRFRYLLERSIELAGGNKKHVVVVSIPDYGVTPFGQRFDPPAIRAALERYNETNRKIATELGVAVVDITPLSRRAAQEPALIAADGLHPSAQMYSGWVELVLPVAEAALQKEAR